MNRQNQRRNQLMGYARRPGCHPCDRAEAGFQLAAVNNKLRESNAKLIELRK